MRFRYGKTCVKWPLSKRQKIGFQGQLLLNAGQKYCRMLQGEHSAILSTFIKLPFVIKTFVLSILSICFTQVLLYLSPKTPFKCHADVSSLARVGYIFHLHPCLKSASSKSLSESEFGHACLSLPCLTM